MTLDNLGDNDTITVYGIGVSLVQAQALSITFRRLLYETDAVFYEEPSDESCYFCYVYYLDRASCLRGYVQFKKNFAIVSSALYEKVLDIQELADILNNGDYGNFDEDDYD